MPMEEQKKDRLTGYNLVNLKDLVEQVGEERTKEILSDFCCPLNMDVEYFLRYKAIEFARQGLSQTHLIFTPYKGNVIFVGYFTLANKVIIINRKTIPNANWRRRIKRFAVQSDLDGGYYVSAPLIGQIGKNFKDERNKLITGDELLKLATDTVHSIQMALGGKIVYLECEDKPQLLNFYDSNGFVNFGHRDLERDERDRQSGQYLVQMLKYLS